MPPRASTLWWSGRASAVSPLKGFGDYSWYTGESGLLDSLLPIAASPGVEVRLNSRVTGLEGDASAVTSVRVEDKTSTYGVTAKKVVLATGGFMGSQKLIEEYYADYAGFAPFCGAGCTGDGLIMCRDLGLCR